jgi:aminopeptidase
MSDPRNSSLAQVLLSSCSLNLKSQEKLLIWSQPAALPLIREVYRTALKIGAYPVVRYTSGAWPPGTITFDGLTEIRLLEASEDQLRHYCDLDTQELEYADALLFIMAEENTQALAAIAPERVTAFQKTQEPLMECFLQRWSQKELRFCGTLYPTSAYGQQASMSLGNYHDFVCKAALVDQADPVAAWEQVGQEQQKIINFLNQHKVLRIVAPGGTDITVQIDGPKWFNGWGAISFPGGAIAAGPLKNSTEGAVAFSYPAVLGSYDVQGVRLTFEKGTVVQASATQGEDILHKMLETDADASRLGEISFGLNPNVTRYTGNVVFDDKLSGSVKLGLGTSLPWIGGDNQSSMHWDMFTDLRQGGQVFADGQLCYKDGAFLTSVIDTVPAGAEPSAAH